MKRLQTWVSAAEVEAIQERARSLGLSVSTYLRWLIRRDMPKLDKTQFIQLKDEEEV